MKVSPVSYDNVVSNLDHIIPMHYFHPFDGGDIILAFLPFNLMIVPSDENRLKGSYLDIPLLKAYFEKLLLEYEGNEHATYWINKLIEKLESIYTTNSIYNYVTS